MKEPFSYSTHDSGPVRVFIYGDTTLYVQNTDTAKAVTKALNLSYKMGLRDATKSVTMTQRSSSVVVKRTTASKQKIEMLLAELVKAKNHGSELEKEITTLRAQVAEFTSQPASPTVRITEVHTTTCKKKEPLWRTMIQGMWRGYDHRAYRP